MGMNRLEVSTMDPSIMTLEDFRKIGEVNQDMWATQKGIGELANCGGCKTMISKEMAF